MCGISAAIIAGCTTSTDNAKTTTPAMVTASPTRFMSPDSDTPAPPTARVITQKPTSATLVLTGASAKSCDCSADLYNCKDFKYHVDAQACYESCKSQNKGDVHKLDADSNGSACEGLS